MKTLTPRRPPSQSTVLYPENMSSWMYEAVVLSAERLGLPALPLKRTKSGNYSVSKAPDAGNLLVFDLVNTGGTVARVTTALAKAGKQFNRVALAALQASDYRQDGRDYVEIRSLREVSIDRISAGSCAQCDLGLPFTSGNEDDEPPTLRSFDIWEMLRSVPWTAETYGAESIPRESYFPSFEELFGRYGDWISHQLQRLIRRTIGGSQVAIVCPDEPAMEKLIDRMQPWADGRLVAVRLPRPVLDLAKPGGQIGADDLASLDDDDGWSRQLRLLADRGASVVLTDEFNGSNTTAIEMIRVVEAFDVSIRAYMPVINRVLVPKVQGIPIEALYHLPSPRGSVI